MYNRIIRITYNIILLFYINIHIKLIINNNGYDILTPFNDK
eukprot:UN22301